MKAADLELLRCPTCRGALTFKGSQDGEELLNGVLRCQCTQPWKLRDGIPILVDEDKIRGSDRFMRAVYDTFACLHDPAAWALLPLMQCSGVDELRSRYMPKLALDALRPGRDGQPPRILEVGIGTGANLPLIESHLPPAVDADIWGCDLSASMLARCQQRAAYDSDGSRVHLLMADAHFLPFPDHSFDRVFHVGGIAGYRAPALALAEMARVAKPDTPIVVVDEQLDPRYWQSPYHRLMFCALTFYTDNVTSPVGALPAAATDVRSEQISRFYYCLSFRMPAAAKRPSAKAAAKREKAPPKKAKRQAAKRRAAAKARR